MKPSPLAVIVCALAASASAACVVSPGGAAGANGKNGLPARDRTYVAVLSGEMPGAFRDVARHSWIVANVKERAGRAGAHRHRRYEWLGDASATDSDNPFDYFGSGEVAIHGVVIEDDAKTMEAMIACLEQATKSYTDSNCGCWPGPNSNTFVDGLIRTCGLGIELPATALGRDYRGVVGASVTEGRTGVQLETWIGGAKLGLKEGVAADLAGVSLGVHFWPPGIEVPINPGRIGVDSSVRREPDPTVPDRNAWSASERFEHRYGAASLDMAIAYDHVADASRAGGLSDRTTFGFAGHAVYGTTVGYAFGFDLGIGAAAPLGFAYDAHLSPVGVGVVLGDMGFIAATSGIGTSGVSSSVRGALELPEEVRLELDFARIARLGLHGGIVVVPSADDRNTTETFFGARARLGTRAAGRFGARRGVDAAGGGSGGFFLGLDRRELSRSYTLGATFGYEIGFGG
jgi:hypothetical protein